MLLIMDHISQFFAVESPFVSINFEIKTFTRFGHYVWDQLYEIHFESIVVYQRELRGPIVGGGLLVEKR